MIAGRFQPESLPEMQSQAAEQLYTDAEHSGIAGQQQPYHGPLPPGQRHAWDAEVAKKMAEYRTLTEGRKDDQGKDGFQYLPADALAAINRVLVFGADKYGARNWERGMRWTRPANALLRHMFAWLRGEQSDAETGMSHLWHAGCCVLFLIAYELRGAGEDDRVK